MRETIPRIYNRRAYIQLNSLLMIRYMNSIISNYQIVNATSEIQSLALRDIISLRGRARACYCYVRPLKAQWYIRTKG